MLNALTRVSVNSYLIVRHTRTRMDLAIATLKPCSRIAAGALHGASGRAVCPHYLTPATLEPCSRVAAGAFHGASDCAVSPHYLTPMTFESSNHFEADALQGANG